LQNRIEQAKENAIIKRSASAPSMTDFFARWENIKACRFHISNLTGLNRIRLPIFPAASCFPVTLLAYSVIIRLDSITIWK